MTNIISAMLNLKKHGRNSLSEITPAADFLKPRINMVGDPLDFFIRDAFCNSFNIQDRIKKAETYKQTFSYFGSQNHPPDMIIYRGDAIEVKRTSLLSSEIQLNSSYPKSKLTSDSPLLTKECLDC